MALIKVQDVQLETVNKGRNVYQIANVIYTNERDERKEKKVVSFSNPNVFNTIKDAVAGQTFNVGYTPGDKYFNWSSCELSTGDFQPTAKPVSNGFSNRATVTDPRETADERAENRVRIVRQSSIGYAVAMLTPGAKSALKLDEVKALAQEIHDWVYDNEKAEGTFSATV